MTARSGVCRTVIELPGAVKGDLEAEGREERCWVVQHHDILHVNVRHDCAWVSGCRRDVHGPAMRTARRGRSNRALAQVAAASNGVGTEEGNEKARDVECYRAFAATSNAQYLANDKGGNATVGRGVGTGLISPRTRDAG